MTSAGLQFASDFIDKNITYEEMCEKHSEYSRGFLTHLRNCSSHKWRKEHITEINERAEILTAKINHLRFMGIELLFQLKVDILNKDVETSELFQKYPLEMLPFERLEILWPKSSDYTCFNNTRKKEYRNHIKILKEEKILALKKEQSEIMISNFLASDKTKSDFLLEIGVTNSLFDNYMDVLKETNPDLFDKASKRLKNNSVIRFHTLITKVEELCKKINSDSKYNLLSYYLDLNLLELKEEILVDFLPKIQGIDKSAFISTKRFLNKIVNLKRFISSNEIFSTKVTIHEKIVTDEEKQKALDFLKINKIPQTRGTYDLSLKKVLAETNTI